MATRPLNCRSQRHGSVAMLVIAVIVILAIVVTAVWIYMANREKDDLNAPLLTDITRGPFDHIVLEQGEVESSNNVEIRCAVKSRSSGNNPSTSILDIVPEGTKVAKDDWLITFDSSALEQEQRQQRIIVNTSKTLVIQAKAAYDTAVIARKEYLEGTYKEEEQTILNEIFVAEQKLKESQLSFESIERSVASGLLPMLQLKGEEYRVGASENELKLARRKLNVLEEFTKEKMLTQLNSDIEAAQVKWENEQASHAEEEKKMEEIDEQIANCKVYAPQGGQVVYANVQSSRSGSEFVVEPGAAVRERQVIIRLPDPKNMQVNAKINESRINLVRKGMPVSVRIEAFGEGVLQGEVTKVNKYAEPGNWWSSTSKQYATVISIKNPPPQIRSGLTAEVRIHVNHLDDALQMPVQAVYEHKGKTFCLVKQGDSWKTQSVAIQSTNEKMVAIDEVKSDKLNAEAKVVMNPRAHADKFDFTGFPGLDEDDSVVKQGSWPSPSVAEGQETTTGEGSAGGQVAEAQPSDEEAGGGGSAGGGRGGSPADMMKRMDTDGDGMISADELSALGGFAERLKEGDTDGDGSISQAELTIQITKLRAQGGGRPSGGPPGGAE